MKLDSKSKIVLAIVAVIFVIFNVIFLLAVDTAAGLNNTTIISWVFMALGFISFLTFAYLSSTKKGVPDNIFMRFTLLGHCTIYLFVDFVLGMIFTILSAYVNVPVIVSVSVQIIALGVHLVIALACLLSKVAVEDVQTEVKQKTSKMKCLRVDAEMLVDYCADTNAKNEFRKFAEAVRYSDPMSCDALCVIEDSLEQIISEMKMHLMSGEVEEALNKCGMANNILKERNRKCQMLK